MIPKPTEEPTIVKKATERSDSTSSEESLPDDATEALLETAKTYDPSAEDQPSTSIGVRKKTETHLPTARPKQFPEMDKIQTMGREHVVRFTRGTIATPSPGTEIVHAESTVNPTKYDLPGVPMPERISTLYAYSYANPINRSNKFSLKWWDYIFVGFAESYILIMCLLIIVGVIVAIREVYFMNF